MVSNIMFFILLLYSKLYCYYSPGARHYSPTKVWAGFIIFCCKQNNYATLLYMYWWGGWVRRKCPVAFVTGAPNWYWLTVGQGLLSLQQVRVEGECCYFFCSFTFFHLPLSSLSLSFILSTISSIRFLPFSGNNTKWPTRVDMSLNPNTINVNVVHMYLRMFITLQADSIIILGAPNRNWPYGICEQGTPRSACASAGSM